MLFRLFQASPEELRARENLSLLLIFTVMWLNAFGVYIGRYLRFNSWDVITDPFDLTRAILNMIVHPVQNIFPWGMTLCYSIFMTFLYFTIKKMSESFRNKNNYSKYLGRNTSGSLDEPLE